MLIILDRDGVINEESNQYIKSPEEWIPIPGSLEAIAKLKKSGYQVAVATNQSGVARGLYTEIILNDIHQKMIDALTKFGVTLDGIYYCPHLPEDNCQCRKPQSGMYIEIAKTLHAQLENTICIGDSLRDIQAALAVNAKPILVLTGNGSKTEKQLNGIELPIYKNLAEAVDTICSLDANQGN